MQLGLVTYQWGADWDLPTVIKNCRQTGFAGVELRSTHKHGVEPSLDDDQRKQVAERFADSGVCAQRSVVVFEIEHRSRLGRTDCVQTVGFIEDIRRSAVVAGGVFAVGTGKEIEEEEMRIVR